MNRPIFGHVLITSNPKHPAFSINEENLHIIFQKELNLPDALVRLKNEFGCDRLNVQSGGKETTTWIDGDSLQSIEELHALCVVGTKAVQKRSSNTQATRKWVRESLGTVQERRRWGMVIQGFFYGNLCPLELEILDLE